MNLPERCEENQGHVVLPAEDQGVFQKWGRREGRMAKIGATMKVIKGAEVVVSITSLFNSSVWCLQKLD